MRPKALVTSDPEGEFKCLKLVAPFAGGTVALLVPSSTRWKAVAFVAVVWTSAAIGVATGVMVGGALWPGGRELERHIAVRHES